MATAPSARFLVEADAALSNGDRALAHVLRAEAVLLGAKAVKGWATEAAPLADGQPHVMLDSLERIELRVASQPKVGGWAYRSVGQYRQRPAGPILAVTSDHPSRGFPGAFPQIVDDELVVLQGLPTLMAVELMHAPVTDTGVASLSAVRYLRHLSLLGCTAVTGKPIANLRGLTHLAFDLRSRPEVPDWLAPLMKLESLSLDGGPMEGGDVLRFIGSMSSLRRLRLGRGFSLTESNFRQLTSGSMLIGGGSPRLPALAVLDLGDASSVDAAALAMLVALPSLERLELGRHSIGAGPRAKLMAAFPRLKISAA